jgi:hypothetical protein
MKTVCLFQNRKIVESAMACTIIIIGHTTGHLRRSHYSADKACRWNFFPGVALRHHPRFGDQSRRSSFSSLPLGAFNCFLLAVHTHSHCVEGIAHCSTPTRIPESLRQNALSFRHATRSPSCPARLCQRFLGIAQLHGLGSFGLEGRQQRSCRSSHHTRNRIEGRYQISICTWSHRGS